MQASDPENNGDFSQEKKMANAYIRYSALGFQMVAIIGIFTFIGYTIDERRHATTPLYTAFLSLLGVFIALYLVIRSVKKSKS